MDATIKKAEQIARMAEQQAREALNKSILVESELRSEIESLRSQVASLEGQLSLRERPTLKDKCDALVEILSNCYQDNAPLSWDDWSEIRKQYVPNDDPDLAGVKEFFLKGQGKDLYKAVVSKPTSPDSNATAAPIPTPTPPTQPLTPAPPAPTPKKGKLKGRVSTEPTVTLVDDPDNLTAAPAPTVPAPTPTFDAPATVNITASLEEVASAGGLSALPSESLGRLSNLFRSVLTGASASVIRDTMAQVEQTDSIPSADRKRIIQFLIEGAAPVPLQQALLESSPFVTSCFSSLFF